MGQGIYRALAMGTTRRPCFPNDDLGKKYDSWLAAVERSIRPLRFASAYEAVPDYCGILLAVDDGFLQEWWKLPDLPHDALRSSVGVRRVVSAKLVPSNCSARLRTSIDRARKKWEAARKESLRLGVPLGPPRLLLVCDWN